MTNLWASLRTAAVVCSIMAISHAYVVPTGTLNCFSRPRGPDKKKCEMIHGFRSCYTKYNMRGVVIARGCSTTQPNFDKCDTNKYGKFKSDKYCYCKSSFCNKSTSCLPNIYCLVTAYSLYLLYTRFYSCGHCLSPPQHQSR